MTTRALVMCLAAGMLASLLGGLSRLAVWPIAPPAAFVQHHGVLLGALLFPGLIGLERAVALGQLWTTPLAALLGVVALALGGTQSYPALMLVAGLLMAQQLAVWRRRPGPDTALPLLACGVLLVSDWRWGQGLAPVLCAPGWATFLILIIASERLELSFVTGRRTLSLVPVLGILLLATALGHYRCLGVGWLLLAVWLARHDLARRNAWRTGLAAFSARAVLLGYLWLGLSGAQLAVLDLVGPGLDRILHGVFVGFVLSMVVAHAPLVFPAICRLPLRFSGWFYAPLLLLHTSLAWRCLGDQFWGAAGNLLAMLVCIAVLAAHHDPKHNPWLAHRYFREDLEPV